MSAVVALLTRSPSDPRLKARMAPVVPEYEQRRELVLAFIDDLLSRLSSIDGLQLKVAVTAPIEGFRIARPCVPYHQLLAQRGDPFRDRLKHAFDDLARDGFRQIILLGSDVPDVPLAHVEHARRLLVEHPSRVVTGPSPDGSFYLVGMNAHDHRVPDIGANVRWGSVHMLDDLEAGARAAGCEVTRVDDWPDVDTAEDVQALITRLTPQVDVAPHTAEVLRRYGLLPQ